MKRHQIAKAGQVILSEIWGKRGAIGFVPAEGDGALCTSHFFLFDVREDRVERGYLQAIFTANYLQDRLDAAARGTTGYAAVRPKQLLEMTIPLPPLAEQRRIVAQVEELAGKVGQAQALRRQTIRETTAFIDAAFAGMLSGVREAERLPVGRLADVRGGIQKTPDRAPGANPVRYLTVAHVQRNHISLSDPRFFEVRPEELDRWRLKPGDILIIEGNGSADQIGRAALFRGEIEPCVHQNHVIRIRPDRSHIEPEYLNAYLNSGIGQQAVQSRSRTTSGLRTLSVGRIKKISILVPPLHNQRRIVARIGRLQANVDALERLQADAAGQLDALLPAVLEKAFEGEL